MTRPLNPATIRPPFARYSHGDRSAPGARLVVCSGQLGMAPDGAVPDDIEEQAELCFANIAAILGEAELGLSDIVRLNAYRHRSARTWRATWRCATAMSSDPPPASTLMIVSGFTRPEFLVEVEAIAAALA